MDHKIPLPIDPHLKDISASLKSSTAVIISAEPGTGKTTRVPDSLLPLTSKTILVIEPRRLAARLSAERIAQERGEKVGETIGYQMRFQKALSSKTRIKFITEGLFSRLAHSDPLLTDIGIVIIDEFHERHIQTDVALSIVRHLCKTSRPDLKLVVMSATLDLTRLKTFLDAPVFDIKGKTYPVTIEHKGDIPLKQAVQSMLEDDRVRGDILVFMTGLGEILRAKKELASIKNADVLALSAEVSENDQKKVFKKSSQRKIILATNVAETSLTLPNVCGVIDLGKAKIASVAPGAASYHSTSKEFRSPRASKERGALAEPLKGSVIVFLIGLTF